LNKEEKVTIEKILKETHPIEGECQPIQDILIKNGFIINDEIDEIGILEYKFLANFFRTDELNIVIVPTLKCNFKCPYCFEEGFKDNQSENKDYFNILKKFSNNNLMNKNRVHVTLFGGEPLLKRDEFFSYLDFISNLSKIYGYNLSVNLVTNGFLLNEDTVNRLLKYDCISIQVTIDGNKETHNKLRILKNNEETFDVIIRNFKSAIHRAISVDSKSKFILRINLLNQDVDDIEPIFSQFSREEIERISVIFRPIYITGHFNTPNCNTVFDLKKFYELAKKIGIQLCQSTYYLQHCESEGGNNFFYVTPDLKLWKCINNMSIGLANIGYIEENGNIMLNSVHMSKWYQKSNPFHDIQCLNCKYLPICFGGCVIHHIKTGKRKCISEEMSIFPYFYA
jgi:uncharacterized protein